MSDCKSKAMGFLGSILGNLLPFQQGSVIEVVKPRKGIKGVMPGMRPALRGYANGGVLSPDGGQLGYQQGGTITPFFGPSFTPRMLGGRMSNAPVARLGLALPAKFRDMNNPLYSTMR
jgi:hypothetical protein